MEVVKHEIKSQLAKLLATEDLIVEHRKVDTAQFNVQTRVLTLPNWEKASNDVYDALVAHEVGHALYTPDREWFKEVQIPPTFVNIVEDVRIEKLMKRRYAGLAKTFYRGYNELSDNDFFEIDGEDLTTLNLADRVNLYYKVGPWVNISFSSSETPIVSLIANAETFDETLSAAEALYNFCKQELEEKKEQEMEGQQDFEDNLQGDGDSSSDDSDDSEFTVSNSDGNASMEDGSGDDDSDVRMASGGSSVEPEIETASSLEEALKGLSNLQSGSEKAYVELPKLDLSKVIVSNKDLHNRINAEWADQVANWDKREEYTSFLPDNIFQEPDEDYYKFKRNAQKEVNYLVKEFECKKSASAYARATTAKTGVLDTAKLHTYKYNEDLFKKVTVVPDGKNHGLVFVLDWSGSMAHVMLDTIKQLYNLLWFCKKVNIPFEVYAFTDSYPDDGISKYAYERKEGLALVRETFSMLNIFTSNVRTKELEEQMKNIFRIGCAFDRDRWTHYHVPLGMNLSGTPLNEAIISLHQILPEFKSRHKLEKVQCVILTDGESAPLHYSKLFKRYWESDGYMGCNYVSEKCVIRNRKTGHTYSCENLGYWADVTDLLLKNIRQELPDMNFIGIRLMGSRHGGDFIRRYTNYENRDRVLNTWRKEKSISIKESGYHTYFGIMSNTLCNEDEFDVEEDATKAQIKRAFVKSLKTKKMNKKILGEFVELVA